MRGSLLVSAAMSSALVASGLAAEPLKRTQPISGRIVARKTGETAVLNPSPLVRDAEIRQDLKAGDVLRTNKSGTLALDFVDHTQIRLGRNTVLIVKEVRAGVPSQLQLQQGALWGRAPRGRANLSIETPSANAGVRGTSWSLSADDDRTTLQVFDGKVELANELGSLSVASGEAALALKGHPPARIAVVNPDERE
ncbi:MAG TPA: FecR family protein, partial [Sphingomicrobium sp.]|nr:FecR family protein [Sphingomicrobium sp.]